MDRRRDMTKLIVAFRNFANAPKNRMAREIEREISVYIRSVLAPFTEVFRVFCWPYPQMVYVAGSCETWVHFYVPDCTL